MHRFTQDRKRITAALLLGLLVYLLIEKNAHGHAAGLTNGSKHDHAAIYSGISCLICDFQLSSADAVPGEFSLVILPAFRIAVTGSLPVLYFNPAPSPFAERGPPSNG